MPALVVSSSGDSLAVWRNIKEELVIERVVLKKIHQVAAEVVCDLGHEEGAGTVDGVDDHTSMATV